VTSREFRGVAQQPDVRSKPRKTVRVDCPQRYQRTLQRPLELDNERALRERLLVNAHVYGCAFERTKLVSVTSRNPLFPPRDEIRRNIARRLDLNQPYAVVGQADLYGRVVSRLEGLEERRPEGREERRAGGEGRLDGQDRQVYRAFFTSLPFEKGSFLGDRRNVRPLKSTFNWGSAQADVVPENGVALRQLVLAGIPI
jgi:hypothetical protein